MSLAQRVTSIHQLSPERGRSPSGASTPRDRKLSFSPLPEDWRAPVFYREHAQPIGAFEVPRAKRIGEFLLLLLSLYLVPNISIFRIFFGIENKFADGSALDDL